MCLILFAHRAHPDFALIVAANRDEWFRRPTAPAAFWTDAPDVFAGRDLEQHGTWLGITRSGRFAALTNHRDPSRHRDDRPSRGELVSRFLRSDVAPVEYLEALAGQAARYNGFSLLVGWADVLCFYSNRDDEGVRTLAPGVYGLSNGRLDEPWQKVCRGKSRLSELMRRGIDANQLLALLDDTELAGDHDLPDTGVGVEWERRLSAMRIVTEGYGTRSSTAVLVGCDGSVQVVEQSFDELGRATGIVRAEFAVES
jgi:uncharacterized protein with NRDE domain